jgi:hypothetical protein
VAGCEAAHKGYAEGMTEHDPPPNDDSSKESLGPLTPDDETAAGDTPEAHDELSPVDLPKDHPGRREAERQSGGIGGTTEGNT